jgi:hypothetical protein
MKDKYYTKATIYTKSEDPYADIKLTLSLSDLNGFLDYPYLLIIQSIIGNRVKLTIYPIMKNEIVKLIIHGKDVSDTQTKYLLKIIRKYDIIHTSGLLIEKSQFYYECYLNLSRSDNEYKDLKMSLDNIKNIFREIKLEVIG